MRRLVISDFHFGASNALGGHPLVLERLVDELVWAEQVIINGDLLSLYSAPLDVALSRAKPLLALVATHVDDVVFLPGNHDHHLVEWATDDERARRVVTGTETSPLAAIERVLGALMPGVSVSAHYPAVTIDGVTYTHGHNMHALGHQIQWPAVDQRRFRRVIKSQTLLRQMSPGDYEGLMAPLFEIVYAIEQTGDSPEATLERARWRALARMRMDNPRPSAALWEPYVGAFIAKLTRSRSHLRPTEYILSLLAQMMSDWEIPDGLVCYAHTHQVHAPLRAPTTPRWMFANSGAWLLDRHVLAASKDGEWHPGTALRVHDGDVVVRRLLDDLSVAQLSDFAAQSAV